MSTARQKIYSRLGISENNIKNNTIFSPPKKSITSLNKMTYNFEKNSKFKSELSNAKKAFNITSPNINKAIKGLACYETCKIDLLVPNTEPPKPLVNAYPIKNSSNICSIFLANTNTKSYYNEPKSPKKANPSSPVKPFSKDYSKKNGNYIHLEDLNHSKKIKNVEVFSPIVKAHKTVETKMASTIASKKDSIMDLIWDKKLKLNNHDRTISINNGQEKISLLSKLGDPSNTKREINLLSTRLNKLFPVGSKTGK